MTQCECVPWWVGYVWHQVGTRTPPESEHRAGKAFLGSSHQSIRLDLLIGQCLHVAFFAKSGTVLTPRRGRRSERGIHRC